MTNKVNKQTNKGKRICTRNNKIYQYVKTFLLEAPYSRSLTKNNHIYICMGLILSMKIYLPLL